MLACLFSFTIGCSKREYDHHATSYEETITSESNKTVPASTTAKEPSISTTFPVTSAPAMSAETATSTIVSTAPVVHVTSTDMPYLQIENGVITRNPNVPLPEKVDIPSVFDGQIVTAIGELAFWGCNQLKSVSLPDSVTSLGSSAFAGCNILTEINLPNGLTDMGDAVFAHCENLTSIVIPNGVTDIGDGAFMWCAKLKSITIPNSVTTVDDNAFAGCTNLASITLPNSITHIGSYAFQWCTSLKAVTVPGSVAKIGDYAFWNCEHLTNVDIQTGVICIGEYAFANCPALTSLTIPSSVTTVGSWLLKSSYQAVVYAAATSAAAEWDILWNPDNRHVVWGYTGS